MFRRSDRLRNTFSSSAKVSKPATDGPEVFWIRLHQRCAARWECISDRSDRFLGRHICLNLFSTGGISLSGQSTFWSQCGLAKGLAVESICGLASDKVLLIYPCSLLEHTRRAAPQRSPAAHAGLGWNARPWRSCEIQPCLFWASDLMIHIYSGFWLGSTLLNGCIALRKSSL